MPHVRGQQAVAEPQGSLAHEGGMDPVDLGQHGSALVRPVVDQLASRDIEDADVAVRSGADECAFGRRRRSRIR